MDTELQLALQPPSHNSVPEFIQYFRKLGFADSQISFLILHEKKKTTFEKLQEKDLEAQSMLAELDKATTITDLEKGLASYRKFSEEVTEEIRKPFTSHVTEKIISPAIELDNKINYKVNAKYAELNSRLLNLRIDAKQKEDERQAKESEKQAYIAHIKNTNIAIDAAFRQRVVESLNEAYTKFLELKLDITDDDLKEMESIVSVIPLGKIAETDKFKFQHLSQTEAMDIAKATVANYPSPDLEKLRADAVALIRVKFQMYDNDLAQAKANPDTAFKQIESHAQSEIKSIEQLAKIQSGVNTLISKSSTPPVVMPEGKAVKEEWLVTNENTFEWCVKVMTAFLSSPDMRGYLRDRKNWGNLDIEAMATALGDYASKTGTKYENIKYEKVLK